MHARSMHDMIKILVQLLIFKILSKVGHLKINILYKKSLKKRFHYSLIVQEQSKLI